MEENKFSNLIILSLINLIQAGAVGAAIYQMYKPVADKDFATQSAIIFSTKRFYKKFVILFLLLGLSIGLFFSFYLKSETLTFLDIFFPF